MGFQRLIKSYETEINSFLVMTLTRYQKNVMHCTHVIQL